MQVKVMFSKEDLEVIQRIKKKLFSLESAVLSDQEIIQAIFESMTRSEIVLKQVETTDGDDSAVYEILFPIDEDTGYF